MFLVCIASSESKNAWSKPPRKPWSTQEARLTTSEIHLCISTEDVSTSVHTCKLSSVLTTCLACVRTLTWLLAPPQQQNSWCLDKWHTHSPNCRVASGSNLLWGEAPQTASSFQSPSLQAKDKRARERNSLCFLAAAHWCSTVEWILQLLLWCLIKFPPSILEMSVTVQ